jgi:hypothetical protein
MQVEDNVVAVHDVFEVEPLRPDVEPSGETMRPDARRR